MLGKAAPSILRIVPSMLLPLAILLNLPSISRAFSGSSSSLNFQKPSRTSGYFDSIFKAPLVGSTLNGRILRLSSDEREEVRNFYRCSALRSQKSDDGDENSSYGWTKQSFAIALPALLGMLTDPILSLVDTVYVGRVGSMELAALGACTSIFHLAFNAFRATTAATTSLVAASLEKNEDEAREVTNISLKFGMTVGLVVGGLLLTVGDSVLSSMGVAKTGGLYRPAADYLYTRSWAAPIVLFIGVAEGAFRGYGDTVIPLIASLTAALINLGLDPLLMFFPFHMGVRGAAAATVFAQAAAAGVYAFTLFRRRMLPKFNSIVKEKPKGVIRAIAGANIAMMMKQGSLLLGWAYATARATRLGAEHVAAHQVALSIWLVFALILDGTAVSSQVLMSRAYAQKDAKATRSLTWYMIRFALVQGVISMGLIDCLDYGLINGFTPDRAIQGHLHKIMPKLALQQILVSLTLVMESLAIGANQFRNLAVGTALSTVMAVTLLARQTTVEGLWGVGIVSLFVGRFLTACVATWLGTRSIERSEQA